MDKINENISAAIRSYCAANPKESGRSLSISEFADKIGASRTSVIRWMSGECTPTLADAYGICRVMGISLDEFTGFKLPNACVTG